MTMDGNFNDYDDTGASPIAMAIVKAFGAQKRVVHVSYNNIFGPAYQDRAMARAHETSVLGAVARYGIDPSVVFSTVTADGYGYPEVRNQLRDQINASGPDNPLFIYAAGPMELLYRALEIAGPNRQYVTVLSHSSWNNIYSDKDCCGANPRHSHDVWDILALDPPPKWLQIRQQVGLDSANVAPNPVIPESDPRWNPWRFLNHKDVDGGSDDNRWLWRRMLHGVQRPDATDAGIMYFLFTGFEGVTPNARWTWPQGWNPAGADDDYTLRRLLKNGILPEARDRANVRFEAELLDRSGTEWVKWPYGSGVSQQGAVRNGAGNGDTARISGRFDQLHSQSGTYDVRIRYYDEPGGACTYRFFAGTGANNNLQRGAAWSAANNPSRPYWSVRTIPDVPLTLDSTVFRLEATRPANGSERCQVDYIEFQKQ